MKNQNRTEFRNAVFERDNHKCVIPWCNEPPADAHHLIERKLWPKESGGYLLDNGVSVCKTHHMRAEGDVITPMALREYAGIKTTVIPDSTDINLDVSKWGNALQIPNRYYIKYPTTPYLPNSQTLGSPVVTDPKLGGIMSTELVITIKMDATNPSTILLAVNMFKYGICTYIILFKHTFFVFCHWNRSG